jgi:hypothetical protein
MTGALSPPRVVVAALPSAVSARAAEISGQWSGTFRDSHSDKTSPVYAILQQDGARLTGSAGPSHATVLMHQPAKRPLAEYADCQAGSYQE